MPLKVNQRLKRFQGLEGSFEADRPRLDVVLACGLRHDRADEIVGQDVRPDFFMNEFWRFASQDIHLHCRLDRSQIELIVPTRTVQKGKILLGRLLGIKQGRHHDDGLGPEARLLDANPSFSDREIFRQRFVRFPIHRTNR